VFEKISAAIFMTPGMDLNVILAKAFKFHQLQPMFTFLSGKQKKQQISFDKYFVADSSGFCGKVIETHQTPPFED